MALRLAWLHKFYYVRWCVPYGPNTYLDYYFVLCYVKLYYLMLCLVVLCYAMLWQYVTIMIISINYVCIIHTHYVINEWGFDLHHQLISMILTYGNFMHSCVSYALGYFPVMISTDVYLMILSGSFPSMVFGSLLTSASLTSQTHRVAGPPSRPMLACVSHV